MSRARSIASGEVHGAPQSSTSGTRCGGLTGWPTRQRARPGSALGEARADDGRGRGHQQRVRRRKPVELGERSRRLSSTISGPFSWTKSTSCKASCRLAAVEIRATAPSGSSARPWRASACNSSRIRRGRRLQRRNMRIGQPHVPAGAGEDRGPGAADQARRRRWRRCVQCLPFSVLTTLTATAPCGADRDRRAAPSTVPGGSPGRAPARPWNRTAPAPDRDDGRR